MSATVNLIQAVPFAQLVRGVLFLSLLTGFLMVFRPLLVGIVRALVLTVRPRPAKKHRPASRT